MRLQVQRVRPPIWRPSRGSLEIEILPVERSEIKEDDCLPVWRLRTAGRLRSTCQPGTSSTVVASYRMGPTSSLWCVSMIPFEAVVSRVTDLTLDVREIELSLIEPTAIAFVAGQFISFEVEAPGWPYPITRSYSIASDSAQRGRIVILLNLVPGGRMSPYLFGLRP